MGDSGARLLAKALQINSKLQYISYDRNNVTLTGYSDIAYAIQRYAQFVYYFIQILHNFEGVIARHYNGAARIENIMWIN